MFYKIELCDKEENLLDQYVFNNKREFDKKYNELKKKYYYSAVLYVFIGNDIDNLTELESMRIYYNGLYEPYKKTPKAPTNAGKGLLYMILYLLITPIAVLIKLGRK